MRTAKQWQEELAGETSTQSIERIQAEAMIYAAGVAVAEMQLRGLRFSDINAVMAAILQRASVSQTTKT